MIALRNCWIPTRRVSLVLVVFSLCVSPHAIRAQTNTVEELQRRLDEREKVISDLMRRVETLEQRFGAPAGVSTDVIAKPPGSATPPPTQVGAATPATAADEEQGNRALERALVREGGLVLPRSVFEIEPAFTYRHRVSDALQIVTVNGQAFVAQQSLKRDMLESSVAFRLGLPWDSQVGLRIPYAVNRQEITTGGSVFDEQTRHRSGWGDLELSLTTQLLRERNALPALLGSIVWKTITGHFSLGDASSPGSGFHFIEAGLTAVKRQDPLVFYGTLSHGVSFKRDISGSEIAPGNRTGLKLGTILAASPETSLRFALEMSRAGTTEVNSERQQGTGTSIAMFEFGVASVISARSLLDFRVAIGLTPTSPNLRLGVAVPIRFY